MKTSLAVIFILLLTIFLACNKEELFPNPTKDKLNQTNQLDHASDLDNTSTARSRVDPKPMLIRTYTESIIQLPVENDEQILNLVANCKDRANIADEFNIKYQALTITTEIADLKRIGLTLDQAATIHAAAYIGVIDGDFIGITDIISEKYQTLDVGRLAALPTEAFYKLLMRYIENVCMDCNKYNTPSFTQIKNWIKSASLLPTLISYERDGDCWKVNATPNKSLNHAFNHLDNITEPIISSPNALPNRKTMITRTYTESFDILPIKTDTELLLLAANCKDRKVIAKQYGIDYQDLTIATEVADLKRLGLTTDQAVTIFVATSIGIVDVDITNTDFIGIVDLIGGRSQTLDIGLFAAMPPKAFFNVLTHFIENVCFDCSQKYVPTFDQVDDLIKTASTLLIQVSYERDGICWLVERKLRYSSNSQFNQVNPTSDPKSLPSTNSEKKPMLTRTYYSEIIKQLPIRNDGELLQITANCDDRKKIAQQFGIDYQVLTAVTEVVDLKRTGMFTDQALLIHAAAYIGIIDVVAGRTDLVDNLDLIKSGEQTIDVGLLAALPSEEFYQMVLKFIDKDCMTCDESSIPTLNQIKKWVEEAKHLLAQVSYEKDVSCIKIQ